MRSKCRAKGSGAAPSSTTRSACSSFIRAIRWKWMSQATAAHPRLERLRRLVPRRGAQIQERLAGREIEQRHDGLRADILRPPAARIFHRLLERRPRNSVGGVPAIEALPARQQPLRARELHFPRRPRDRVAIHVAQDRVDQPGGGALARPLHQLHTVPDRRVGRYTVQVAKLVDAHAQRRAHLEIELFGRRGAVDQVVQLSPVAQHAEDDLGRQPRIP